MPHLSTRRVFARVSVRRSPTSTPKSIPASIPAAQSVSFAPPKPAVFAPALHRVHAEAREDLLALLWKLPEADMADVLEAITANLQATEPPRMPFAEPPSASEAANDFAPESSGIKPRLSMQTAPEDTLDVLFESMYELNFLNDAVRGARLCLDALARSLPCRRAYVHFYDVDSREFVTVATMGDGAAEWQGRRHSDSDWQVLAAMFKRQPFVVDYKDGFGLRPLARHRLPGGPKTALIAPVFAWGRCLALIELVDPELEEDFTPATREAVAYVCNHFSAFLGTRGVDLGEKPPPMAA